LHRAQVNRENISLSHYQGIYRESAPSPRLALLSSDRNKKMEDQG
jgi:hypothetical protein